MVDRLRIGIAVRVSVAVAAATLMVGGSVPAASAQAAETTVKIKDNFFTPSYKVITVGDSVKWINEGADRHTVTSYEDSPQAFDSSPETEATCDDANPLSTEDCLEPGQEFGPIAFTTAGTYEYRCKVHSIPEVKPDKDAGAQEQPCGMCGIVRVIEERENNERPTRDPRPGRTVESARPRSPSPTPTPSETPTDENGSPIAAPGEQDGGNSGGRLLLALLLLGALGGAGYWTWRTYFS